MLRRFLYGLKKSIECALREHVDLIDDIYLICCSCRCEIDFLENGSDIIHTVIGSGIHLSYIKDGTVKDTLTGRTLIARIAVDRVFAVNAACEDLGDSSLSGTVLAAEKICMG